MTVVRRIASPVVRPLVRAINAAYGISSAFTPAKLFTTGVNGAWYDPSDYSTLFQNAAGTTPVTAVEQPVGRMLDKSGRGNHAFNGSGNSANFPVLSARYNLLTKTEQFDDAAWTKDAVSINANATTSPDGTLSADKLTATSAAANHWVYQAVSSGAATTTFSVRAKAGNVNWIALGYGNGNPANQAYFDLASGAVGNVPSGLTASISSLGSGWYQCSMTFPVSQSFVTIAIVQSNGQAINWSATGTEFIYIWGADLRVANDALNQPAYQRVNTSTDYDTVGFKPYLRFNGTNQWLQTNSIDFSYGDKMFVSAGVRKLSDAARGMVVELGSGVLQAFGIGAPGYLLQQYDFYSQGSGTAGNPSINTGYSAPITNVLSGIGNISGDQAILRVNGTQVASSTTDQGTGNYGNYPLYLGARAGTSLWFNGRLYGMVVAGKQASAAEITSTETYLNQKTGAF